MYLLDSSELTYLKETAILAGQIIMKIYNSDELQIEYKDDESPLTLADQAANDCIVNRLRSKFISTPIISEENKAIAYETRKDFRAFWMVDPLDGTKEFIRRNGEFTVNIALIQNQQSTCGVVYVPATDQLYWAQKGQGAYREQAGRSILLEANSFGMRDSGIAVVTSRSHLNQETKEFLNLLNAPTTLAKGSSLKFLSLAEGQAHIYPRIAPTMEWDTAAAHIILTESGGQVLDYEHRMPLLYNKSSLLNPHFIALAKLRSE